MRMMGKKSNNRKKPTVTAMGEERTTKIKREVWREEIQ